MSIVLDVTVRENTGTGGARASRREGLVPGVIYGGDQDAVAVALKSNEVTKAINTGNFIANMIELSHKGDKQKVLTKDIQFHPVTDVPLHVDFYRVTAKSIIVVEVSVNFIGEEEAVGIKMGGVLNVVRHSIEVKCPAGDIPDSIEVDISALDIGDSIHISEIKLPANVEPAISDRDFTICTMQMSRAAIEETESEEDEEALEGEEGEEGVEGEAAAEPSEEG